VSNTELWMVSAACGSTRSIYSLQLWKLSCTNAKRRLCSCHFRAFNEHWSRSPRRLFE